MKYVLNNLGLILDWTHFSKISISNALFPISENPAAIILIFLVPFNIQSSTIDEQNLAATTIITKSIGSFKSLILEYDVWLYNTFPPILVFIGYNFPL